MNVTDARGWLRTIQKYGTHRLKIKLERDISTLQKHPVRWRLFRCLDGDLQDVTAVGQNLLNFTLERLGVIWHLLMCNWLPKNALQKCTL